MRKINEIFYSLQGEGYHTGCAAVFIRFSMCNLQCEFCDTMHQDGIMMSDEEIVNGIMKYPQSKLIVLTGGEPSLFISHSFIDMIKNATGMKIAIETNGTCSLPDNIDWITLSPKTGFTGGDVHPMIITHCNELKVVFTGQSLDKYFNISAQHYYLQPCATNDVKTDDANTSATIVAILNDPRWRLSLQTHKLIGIR
ncbi:MAG: radical SAM protein [Muribaculaceae bacterium]